MTARRPLSWHEPDVSRLEPDSYTASRLLHATPEHLHTTSRRFFIGPVPEGWLKTHRRDWYRQHDTTSLSPAATFPSNPRQARQRRVSGLEGPSASALFTRSFPQPEDCSDEEEGQNGNTQTTSAPSAPEEDAVGPSSLKKPDLEEEVQSAEGGLEFVDAPSEPEDDPPNEGDEAAKPISPKKPRATRQSSGRSYVTASSTLLAAKDQDEEREEASSLQLPTSQEEGTGGSNEQRSASLVASSAGGPCSQTDPPEGATSTTSLLHNANTNTTQADGDTKSPPKGILAKIKKRTTGFPETETQGPSERRVSRTKSNLRHLVKFDVPEDSIKRAELHLKAKSAQMTVQRASAHLRRPKLRDGLVVKMERMLVRVDEAGKGVPDDFDENGNQKIESRVKEKWREYMVVCRQCVSDDADFVLQMYKTRVIPEIEQAHTNKRAKFEVLLGRKSARVNLYSSLDKSLAVWLPVSRGTRIFVMQARTASNAVEWYTFIRNILGWRRASEVQINVPDLSISLRIRNPFQKLEASQSAAVDLDDDDNEEAILQTMKEEQAVARNLVKRCVEMIADSPEWKDILETWLSNQRIGLAWKRYDRLEWVHGANERKMYGAFGMQKSHDLELRPKTHYPTTAITRKKHKSLSEPMPVEGFLIRLTSQRGTTRRLGILYHKQLYFSTHDQYLVFSRPAKAMPPMPPKLPVADTSDVPPAGDIRHNVPDTWTVDPYPLKDNEIEWISAPNSGTAQSLRVHDEEAQDEANRKAHNLLNCDGFINLCNVDKVRKAHKGASPLDQHIDSGSDVDFDEDVNDEATRDDGITTDFDVDRSLELILKNGVIIRLQAASKERRKDWVKHLRALGKYWKLRRAADISLLMTTRAQNLAALKIDEEGEAAIGQYAKKWEVGHTYACPELYNLCGIANCRSIHISGTLYRKPRIHAPFTRCAVILSAGSLLIFQDVVRSTTGKPRNHAHHAHIANLDLMDCYVYSGLLTEPDLLYHNQTFDANKPGHHALPRVYLEDGWTSTDEDVMTTFVVWHGKSKSWFRSEEGGGGLQAQNEGRRTKLKRVAKLGSTGRSVVFRARSRAERDHWVLAIQNEIERVQVGRGEDFRIEESAKGESGQRSDAE